MRIIIIQDDLGMVLLYRVQKTVEQMHTEKCVVNAYLYNINVNC